MVAIYKRVHRKTSIFPQQFAGNINKPTGRTALAKFRYIFIIIRLHYVCIFQERERKTNAGIVNQNVQDLHKDSASTCTTLPTQ